LAATDTYITLILWFIDYLLSVLPVAPGHPYLSERWNCWTEKSFTERKSRERQRGKTARQTTCKYRKAPLYI